jgi:hypothetical protein
MAVVHCKHEPDDVYIGRGVTRAWANRVPGLIVVGSVEEAIATYRRTLWEEIRSGWLTLERLATLHGKTLGCWCAPDPCHGEVLELAAGWAANRIDGADAGPSARIGP